MEKSVFDDCMSEHFAKIAEKYLELRTTDEKPIQFIKNILNQDEINAADIGCGDGRYDMKLFQYLNHRLFLYCIDSNNQMLEQLKKRLSQFNIRNFKTRHAIASKLPLYKNTIDCVFTFNAIHHFNISEFLNEVSRVLKNDGRLFIYTRTRSQNKQNIWGRYFPLFGQKETRLYEMDEFEAILENIGGMNIESVNFFKHKRISSIDRLVEKATNCHYSTFRLYSKNQFEKSLAKFKQRLQENFQDGENIQWCDENVMLIAQKERC